MADEGYKPINGSISQEQSDLSSRDPTGDDGFQAIGREVSPSAQKSNPLYASSGGSSVKSSRFVIGTSIEKPSNTDGVGLLAMLLHPLCVLLVFCPLGMYAGFMKWSGHTIFLFNFLGLIPLAKILGDATEELAAGLQDDMLAGMLNATFGNAVEVVIMVQTLRANLVEVVKATLLGSVLSNLLLVLGCSFFFGGIISRGDNWNQAHEARSSSGRKTSYGPPPTRDSVQSTSMNFTGEKVQIFSVMTAMVNCSLLLLSCLSLSLVTLFFSEDAHGHDDAGSLDISVLEVSRHCAVAMMLSYVAYVFFQLVTHRESMADFDDEEDAPEEAALSIKAAMIVMVVTTVIVAFASELLVESLDEVVEKYGVSRHFIGIILLPIVGNACEHASAVRFAIQDKPGLSIGIAAGSSTQISLFVVPLSVLMGWWLDVPMDLNFGSLNTAVLSISVLVVLSIVVDGSATWLQGYLLMTAYYVVGTLYWHLPDKMKEFS